MHTAPIHEKKAADDNAHLPLKKRILKNNHFLKPSSSHHPSLAKTSSFLPTPDANNTDDNDKKNYQLIYSLILKISTPHQKNIFTKKTKEERLKLTEHQILEIINKAKTTPTRQSINLALAIITVFAQEQLYTLEKENLKKLLDYLTPLHLFYLNNNLVTLLDNHQLIGLFSGASTKMQNQCIENLYKIFILANILNPGECDRLIDFFKTLKSKTIGLTFQINGIKKILKNRNSINFMDTILYMHIVNSNAKNDRSFYNSKSH